jgi:hypothetical protein
MGTFTMRLGEVLDHVPTLWDDGDDAYPIFDEAYRATLNRKIIDHYFMYEIGHETIGQFKFALNRKMREIMPLYNQLYKSEALLTIDNALLTTNMVTDSTSLTTETNSSITTSDQTTDTTSETTGHADSKSRTVSSDMPQTMLSPDEDYASAASDANSQTDNTSTATGSGTTDTTLNASGEGETNGTIQATVKGSQGHTAALVAAYRNAFLNIDLNVIAELESLFMAVWDNGDSYSDSNPYIGGIYYGRAYWFAGL